MIEKKYKIVVLGIGNLLLGDEGIGVHLLRELERVPLPPQVKLIDGGTATLDILPLLQGIERLIVIDAMKAGGEPGRIYRCGTDDLVSSPLASLSLHHIDFLQALQMARGQGDDLKDRTTIFGVEPCRMEWSMELSPVIQEKIPLLKKLVLEEIHSRLSRSACNTQTDEIQHASY